MGFIDEQELPLTEAGKAMLAGVREAIGLPAEAELTGAPTPPYTEPAEDNRTATGAGNFLSLSEAHDLTGIQKPTLIGRIKAGKLVGRPVQVGARTLWYVERASLEAQEKPTRLTAEGQVRPDLKVRNGLLRRLGRMPTKLETYAEMQRLGIPLKPFQLKRLEANDGGPSKTYAAKKVKQQNTDKLPKGVSALGGTEPSVKLSELLHVLDFVRSGMGEIISFDVTLRVRQ